jgi:hypothetical protein
MVRSITVTLSGEVTLDAGAFELVRDDGTVVTPDVEVAVVDGMTVATLTFSGPDIIGGSLADGQYTLTIRGDKVRNGLNQALDGDGDDVAGGDRVVEFFRLFGDSDGNGDVDGADKKRFREAAEAGPSDPLFGAFDYDGDGSLGGPHAWGQSIDFRELVRRMRNRP